MVSKPLGAEISSASQNFSSHLSKQITESINLATYLRIACMIVDDICRRFNEGTGPWKIELFQRTNKIPVDVLNGILTQLTNSGIILANGNCYLPAKTPGKINVTSLYDAFFGRCDKRILSLLESHNTTGIIKKLDEGEPTFVIVYLASLSTAKFLLAPARKPKGSAASLGCMLSGFTQAREPELLTRYPDR